MRILNRPATAAEVETCRKDMQAVDDDHRRMAEELGKRETEFALKRPELERQRQAAIAAAQTALAAYEKEQAPKLAEQSARRPRRPPSSRPTSRRTNPRHSPRRWPTGKRRKPASIVNRWLVLEPKTTSATNRSTLTKEPDGSIIVSGRNKNGVVTIVGRDRADRDHRPAARGADRQPPAQQGPRPRDGRQLRAQRARADGGPQGRPEAGQAGQARKRLGRLQPGQPSKSPRRSTAVSNDPGNGWAVSPATGVIHWATFETSEPIGGAGGTVLTFKLHHKFGERLDARPVPPVGHPRPQTCRPQPAGRLPRDPGDRTRGANRGPEEPAARLFPCHRRRAAEKVDAVNASKAPLPIDPKLKELRDQLEFAQRPVQPDPVLVALRRDLEISVQQAATRRLTAAQDIAWALINSPAFLFNH